MSDIDLLVREGEAPEAMEILAALGFQESHATWKHRVFEPRSRHAVALGEHADNSIHIELHTHLLEALPVRRVDITHLVLAEPLVPGLNEYPSRAALLLHALLHASGTMVCRALRMLHLQDVARVSLRMTPSDWEEFFRARTTLANVSLSYLWVSAFPGIQRARSLREVLTYGAERIFPSSETRHLREAFAATQPEVSGGEWAHLPQRRRALRWLRSGQARYESVRPVCAALGWDA